MSGARKRKVEEDGSLFEGCVLTFFRLSHMARMKERVQQLGGRVEKAVCADTTHLLVPKDLTPAQAAELTAGSRGGAAPCVTQDWVSQSILTGKRQPEAQYRPTALAAAEAAAVAAKAAEEAAAAPPAEPFPAGQEGRAGGSDAETVPFSPGELREIFGGAECGPSPPPQSQQQQAAEAAAAAACVVERRGSDWVAVAGERPRFTGGHTGIPWGTAGVFEEPVDEGGARETLEVLRRFWFRERGAPPGPSPAGARRPGSACSRDDDSRPASPGAGGAEGGGGVCGHAACAARAYCLLAKLEEVKALYLEGRDHFKIKAVDKAQAQLAAWRSPLRSPADVDAVGLGGKSCEKVKEILATGGSARVEAAAHDEQRQVLRLFTDVWGAASETAARWYRAGCRTLDDVRAQPALTAQQQVGLRYFDDINTKIPAAEVAAAERVVRGVILAAAEGRGARDAERTYCFATGSYCRGAPESNDIDMLTCLPPSLDGEDCGVFLREVLAILLARGFLLDEMSPGAAHARRSGESATFLGVCRPAPGGPARRIDFKVYGPRHAATAVAYFANSMAVCRALRHYARRGLPPARLPPGATGFKVSDLEMVPIRSPPPGHGTSAGSQGDVLLPPALALSCETDLFERLGLAYVPPRMRVF